MTTDEQQARPAAITTPTDREIHIERVFDAPRDRVFAAFTDPELIPPPERIVQTFEVEGPWGKVHVETIVFEDLGDRTKLTTTLVFETTEERDGVLAYGAETGANESYARLDQLLAKLTSS